MFDPNYIIAPLVGGIIGYITNDIAIRMLFRPHKPKYLLGMKIPFTPGIIPKEKGRIAKAIGGAISENLMSKEVLEKNLLSDEMIGKIRSSIDEFFDTQRRNPETVREFLSHLMSAQEVDAIIDNVKKNLTNEVGQKIAAADLGEQIADTVVQHISAKLSIDGLDIPLPGMLRTVMGNSIWGKLASMMEKPIRNFLAKNINQMLADKGPEMAANLINREIDDFSAIPMQQLLDGKDAQIAQFTDSCIGIYRMVISEHLPRILDTIDIPIIIEARINEMDMAETEKLIFQVMDKELKAIVWLGALLGFLMGGINLLF